MYSVVEKGRSDDGDAHSGYGDTRSRYGNVYSNYGKAHSDYGDMYSHYGDTHSGCEKGHSRFQSVMQLYPILEGEARGDGNVPALKVLGEDFFYFEYSLFPAGDFIIVPLFR